MTMYYQLLGKLEKLLAKRQGKGWGAASVEHELHAVAHLLTPSKQIQLAVDVGGNVGNYTATLREKHPQAEVHVFEPSQTNITILNERFSDDEGVTVQPYALASTESTATLYADSPGSGLGSLTRRRLDHRDNDFAVSESVQTIVFDHYWENTLDKRPIDLLKLDIEGHELDALQGSMNALKTTQIVQFEFGGCNIDTRTFFQDFWYFFQALSFDLYRITPKGTMKIEKYRERDEFFSTTNYLAISRRSVNAS